MQLNESDSALSIDHFSPGAARQFVGTHHGAGLRVALVVSRFNATLTGALASSARDCLVEHGVREVDLTVVWVPGAFEIPLAAQTLLDRDPFDALIALGVVIEGETPHADLITTTVTQALCKLGCERGLPVIDGVLAARTLAQAEARALSGRKSRGWYAGLAAIETARVIGALQQERR